jgi:hypothetical protein
LTLDANNKKNQVLLSIICRMRISENITSLPLLIPIQTTSTQRIPRSYFKCNINAFFQTEAMKMAVSETFQVKIQIIEVVTHNLKRANQRVNMSIKNWFSAL